MSKRFETSSSAASGTSTLPRYNLSRRWFLISGAAGVRAFCEPCAGNDDLVRHLESFGLRCVSSGDIAQGQDALPFERFDAPVITNPPFTRNVLLPLLAHFIATAPSTWLLLPADFAHVAYARP